jgi:hypothetical protein
MVWREYLRLKAKQLLEQVLVTGDERWHRTIIIAAAQRQRQERQLRHHPAAITIEDVVEEVETTTRGRPRRKNHRIDLPRTRLASLRYCTVLYWLLNKS